MRPPHDSDNNSSLAKGFVWRGCIRDKKKDEKRTI